MRINTGCALNLLILPFLMTTAAAADDAVNDTKKAAVDAKDAQAADAVDAEIMAMNKELTASLEGRLNALPAIRETDADAVVTGGGDVDVEHAPRIATEAPAATTATTLMVLA